MCLRRNRQVNCTQATKGVGHRYGISGCIGVCKARFATVKRLWSKRWVALVGLHQSPPEVDLSPLLTSLEVSETGLAQCGWTTK